KYENVPYPNGITLTPVDIPLPFTDDTVRLEVPTATFGHFRYFPALTELPKIILHTAFDVVPGEYIHGGEYEDRTHVVPDTRN
ncbi:MAG: hypothetical protein ABIQ93_15600, partial [Saprospiraceae bacterium]